MMGFDIFLSRHFSIKIIRKYCNRKEGNLKILIQHTCVRHSLLSTDQGWRLHIIDGSKNSIAADV